MDVVWDPEKARSNLKKHGVRFSDAEMVLLIRTLSPEKTPTQKTSNSQSPSARTP
jgi:uncharacterized DUF497 family protein